MALSCVLALVVTGVYMTWRGVGVWQALIGTEYGLLLVGKIAGMVLLIGLGYLARRYIKRGLMPRAAVATPSLAAVGSPAAGHPVSRAWDAVTQRALGGPSAPGVPTMRRLRRSVTVELCIVVVILGLTAVLVNTPTGRESYGPPASATVPFNTGGPGGAGTVHMFVTPARLGPNTIDVYFSKPDGRTFVPAQVTAGLYFPAKNIGPFPITLTAAAPGQYRTQLATFTFTGQWQLQLTVRSDAFDETTLYIPVAVHQPD
jgi:copper transport protein